MAPQYSSAPPYSAQYPPAPYYTPFAPAAGQQASNGTAGFPQQSGIPSSVQTSTSLSNAARYDANANVVHQPVSVPFAPHFTPELLKHFAQLPPPPPPPGAHFMPLPGTAAGLPPFPQPINSPAHNPQQQNYTQFQQSPAILGGGSFSSQGLPTAQEIGSQSQNAHMHRPIKSADQISPAQATVDTMSAQQSASQVFNGDPRSSNIGQRATNPSDFHSDTQTPPSMDQNGHAPQMYRHTDAASARPFEPIHQTQAGLPDIIPKQFQQSEMKERAKAALLSLVPYNIRYDSFIAEGINARVLQQLYSELGLNWHVHESKVSKGSTYAADAMDTTEPRIQPSSMDDGATATKTQSPKVALFPIAKPPGPATPVSRASPAINPSIERKDRIAQLLAAKAGKTASARANSQSQSPPSAAGNTHNQSVESNTAISALRDHSTKSARSLPQPNAVRQKMEQLKEVIAQPKIDHEQTGNANAVGSDDLSAAAPGSSQASLATTLPTPIREQLIQEGFSSLIPGLFMTSAESDEAEGSGSWARGRDPSRRKARTETAEAHIQQEIGPRSRKRPVADDAVGDQTDGSRPAKQLKDQESAFSDAAMQDAEASDGEIIEETIPMTSAISKSAQKDPTVTAPRPAHSDDEWHPKQQGTVRKRVAEANQRRDLDRRQSYIQSPLGSNTPTPTLSLGTQTLLSSPGSKISDQQQGSAKPEDRTNQSPISLVKATPEQIAAKAAQLKANFLQQRALRQKQLQHGIPILNDELAKTQAKAKEVKAKLVQVQEGIKQYEAQILRAQEEEKELLQEVERLDKQISEGESGQKRFSNELSDLKQQTPKDQSTQQSLAAVVGQQPSQPAKVANDPILGSAPETSRDQPPSDDQDMNATVSNAEHEPAVSAEASINAFEPSPTSESISHVGHSPERAGQTFDSNSQNEDLDFIHVQDQAPANLENQSQPRETPDENSDEAMEESEESDDSRMSIDDDTNDSASMSDSGSEEYEPAEPHLQQRIDEKMESDEYEPEIENDRQQEESAGEDADDYEPTDSHGPLDTPEVASTPTASSRSLEDVATTAATTAYGQHNPTNNASHESTVEPVQVSETTEEPKDDELGGGLRSSEAVTLTKPQHRQTYVEADGPYILGATEPSSVRYVPYQSPITSFKSYRFHPVFNQQVKDGYRSLTYSHKIDPKLPMCPTELDGNVCSDPQCQDQHFESMALTDDKILVQMSSANDIKDKGLRDQYLLGLKQVIARLRQEGVKEFSAVADALSQYRREWQAAQPSI